MYASGACNWFITVLVVWTVCGFMQLRYPLELFARAVDCLPIPGLFVSVVDIHGLYMWPNETYSTQPLRRAKKKNRLKLWIRFFIRTCPLIFGSGGGGRVRGYFLIKICTLSPNIPPTRDRTRLAYKKHPFPNLNCMHIRVQSFNWAGDSSREWYYAHVNFWRLNSQCVHFWRLNSQCVTVTECTLASR